MDFVKNHKNLRMGANLHDADGISNWEDAFEDACNAMGVDPAKTKTLDFSVVNKTYLLSAMEDSVLKPLEDNGMDFWWIDW